MTATTTTARPASPTRAVPKATAPAPATTIKAAATTPPPVALTATAATTTTTTTPAPQPPPPSLDRDGLQRCVEAWARDRIGPGPGKAPLTYNPATASSWAASLAGELGEAVRSFLAATTPSSSPPSYKVVAQVSVTQRVGQGVTRSAGCLWEGGVQGGVRGVGGAGSASVASQQAPDGCGWAAVENAGVGVVVEAYALYVR